MLKTLLLLPILTLVASCGSGSNNDNVSESEITSEIQKVAAAESDLSSKGCAYSYANRYSAQMEINCRMATGSRVELYSSLEKVAVSYENFANRYYGKTFTYQGETKILDDVAKRIFLTKADLARAIMSKIKSSVDEENRLKAEKEARLAQEKQLEAERAAKEKKNQVEIIAD